MKPLLIPLIVLCATPAVATPISFELITSPDRFRVVNTSDVKRIIQVHLRPAHPDIPHEKPTVFDPAGNMDPSFPDQDPDSTEWRFIGGFDRLDWAEMRGDFNPASILEVVFSYTPPQGLILFGLARAESLQSGVYTADMVPEPASVVLMLVGVAACIVAWKRKTLTERNER